jgi:hypothetical protein
MVREQWSSVWVPPDLHHPMVGKCQGADLAEAGLLGGCSYSFVTW